MLLNQAWVCGSVSLVVKDHPLIQVWLTDTVASCPRRGEYYLFTLLTIVKQGLGAASVLHPAAAAAEEELAHFQNLPLSPACANLQLGLLVQTPSSQPCYNDFKGIQRQIYIHISLGHTVYQ